MKPNKAGHSKLQVSLKFLLREYAEALILAVLLAFLVRAFVVSAYRIPTLAMSPTLLPGDFIFAYKLPYGFPLPFSGGTRLGGRLPGRGEVVIFRCPYDQGVSCIKRVVGLPGDRVEIRGKRLILNGKAAKYKEVANKELAEYDQGKPGAVVEESWGDFRHRVLIGPRREKENHGPLVVPPGHLFVLSDNRDEGEDSRKWGLVSVKSMEARAGVIWLSLGWKDGRKSFWPSLRWPRVLQPVD